MRRRTTERLNRASGISLKSAAVRGKDGGKKEPKLRQAAARRQHKVGGGGEETAERSLDRSHHPSAKESEIRLFANFEKELRRRERRGARVGDSSPGSINKKCVRGITEWARLVDYLRLGLWEASGRVEQDWSAQVSGGEREHREYPIWYKVKLEKGNETTRIARED